MVKSLPDTKRHSRRIKPDFVPIFDDDIQVTTTPKPRVSSLPIRKPKIQPRGEGFRLQYQPLNTIPRSLSSVTKRKVVPLTRRRFEERPPAGSRYYVVKRKRRPHSVANNNRRLGEENEIVEAKASINYQTDKSFHHESVLDNGERHGQYGYIDPIGVRRVVNYATSDSKTTPTGILKAKENDYVGPNTYFQAN